MQGLKQGPVPLVKEFSKHLKMEGVIRNVTNSDSFPVLKLLPKEGQRQPLVLGELSRNLSVQVNATLGLTLVFSLMDVICRSQQADCPKPISGEDSDLL